MVNMSQEGHIVTAALHIHQDVLKSGNLPNTLGFVDSQSSSTVAQKSDSRKESSYITYLKQCFPKESVCYSKPKHVLQT